MDVMVFTEARFVRDRRGTIRSETQQRGLHFWSRYGESFERVIVGARVRNLDNTGPELTAVEGPGVEVLALPDYGGLKGFLSSWWKVANIFSEHYRRNCAYIFRIPGHISIPAVEMLSRKRHPWAVELVGDPQDAFGQASFDHPVRPIIQRGSEWFARRQIRGASGVSYVTSSTLQSKYPATQEAVTSYYSSVKIGDEAFVSESLSFEKSVKRPHLVYVAMMHQGCKGHDVLLKTMDELQGRGMEPHLTLVGDGKLRTDHEATCRSLGLEDCVDMVGKISKDSRVRDYLDEADLFVMPSRTEGLPRALIEAMARAKPCVGTRVGGIPELLDDQFIVPPESAELLADKIAEVVQSPKLMEKMSRQNLEKAKQYHHRRLDKRRTQFYDDVREFTEQWL